MVSYYYQQETISKIREDPYRLLAFGVDFKECDRISQALGFQLDAPIRLAASAEEALYCHLSSGSTLATRYDLDIWLRQLLHIPNNIEKTQFTLIKHSSSPHRVKTFLRSVRMHYRALGLSQWKLMLLSAW
ncbi:hypothetical protein H2136_02330 [Aeromonas hydrophila]|uniref:ATP-dependent RecD2 DNA helicase-like helix-hairpin-helix domain-containing protein n=1 Tax=Aeromonas hydrophila TaxID=644 RepID=A0A926FPH4_AERHY|nr:hypothetical protein [Aeromonas hydrophila]